MQLYKITTVSEHYNIMYRSDTASDTQLFVNVPHAILYKHETYRTWLYFECEQFVEVRLLCVQ